MTCSEAIELLKQRNQRYAQKRGINDYVRQSEQIINAFIACANEKNGQLKQNNEKTPFPFVDVEVTGFNNPITNLTPSGNYTLSFIYTMLVNKFINLKERTEKLRSIIDKNEARKYKSETFPYVTFSGIFTKRDSSALVKHSNLIVIDFDHAGDLSAINELKSKLLKDKYFDTLLMFRSPSGDGLKWLVNIDVTRYSHKEWFDGIYHYIKTTYGYEIDKSGSDVARACFLCYDAQAYINPNIYRYVQPK